MSSPSATPSRVARTRCCRPPSALGVETLLRLFSEVADSLFHVAWGIGLSDVASPYGQRSVEPDHCALRKGPLRRVDGIDAAVDGGHGLSKMFHLAHPDPSHRNAVAFSRWDRCLIVE